jgi:glycosyltransferase involved in cell wall biosynthesis
MREANAIHGMWIGHELSKLEQLTIRSFLHHGHAFNLWLYDELESELPDGVVVRDASTILPRDRIFRKQAPDPGGIVGRDSYGPFSDLFRYKLLHDHGGTWVDMDVTCLRPFDFETPYLFRPHKIGVVGNLLKAPKGSELMRQTFEMSEGLASEGVPWLALNKILTRNIYELGLQHYVRDGIVNDDAEAGEIIRAYAGSGFKVPPQRWYAIHWTNEFWGTRAAQRDLAQPFPTKDAPAPGSFLHELYRKHCLVDSRTDSAGPCLALRRQSKPQRRVAMRNGLAGRNSLNMIIPTLNRGGAERIAIDVAAGLCEQPDLSVNLYVRQKSRRLHPVPELDNLHVHFLDQPGAPTLIEAADEMVGRGNPVVFTHLLSVDQLAPFWDAGLLTIPVIHNAQQGWNEDPTGLDHPNVPFVIACCDTVGRQFRELGCKRPIITVRHEIAWSPSPDDLATARRKIRDRWGIGDDVLLIGMIGQFKSQKAYPRAIRILEELRNHVPAKLMIVGGWDHNYGSGRQTFEATMRLAVDSGVVADLILAGESDSPADYLAAFDVMLNTSVFEGLSISLMEAMACGCPVVASAVGGIAEIANENVALVEDGADVDSFCAAILHAVQREARLIPPPPADPQLVPQIWLGLSKVATRLGPSMPTPNGTLFVIDGVHLGGPAVSLARILANQKRCHRVAVLALTGISAEGLAETMSRAEAEVLTAPAGASSAQAAQFVLDLLFDRKFATVAFWSAPAEVKLLVAKLLEPTSVQLVDVSPGPMLFDELEDSRQFQQRIAFTANQYFGRLDRFVSLYKEGTPEARGYACRQADVIPLGAPKPPHFVPLPPAQILPPETFDPAFAIGTVTRLVPYKKVELLLDAMAILKVELPRANLTIIGGPDSTSLDYAQHLRDRASELGLANTHFAGAYGDINRFLASWKLFLLSGERQGCPNASLEAMAMGLPVIAFDSGGLREQVISGKTGYVVRSAAELAKRAKTLLTDRERLAKMSRQARNRARSKFDVNQCAARFAEIVQI